MGGDFCPLRSCGRGIAGASLNTARLCQTLPTASVPLFRRSLEVWAALPLHTTVHTSELPARAQVSPAFPLLARCVRFPHEKCSSARDQNASRCPLAIIPSAPAPCAAVPLKSSLPSILAINRPCPVFSPVGL